MADDEIDLTKGDPERAEKITRIQQGGAKASGSSSKRVGNSGATRKRETAASKVEGELRQRMDDTLDRIVKALIARQDHELAEAISEDQGAIIQGFISITRMVTWLRNPLVIVMNLVDPLLAFWRVGRIMLGRWYERRAMAAAAAQNPPPPEWTEQATEQVPAQ